MAGLYLVNSFADVGKLSKSVFTKTTFIGLSKFVLTRFSS